MNKNGSRLSMIRLFLFFSFIICTLEAQRLDSALQNLERFDQKHLQDYIDKELNQSNKEQNIKPNNIINSQNSHKYFFKSIIFEKTKLNLKENIEIIKTYENRILTTQDILDIISKTTNNLIKKGYSTSAVTIKQIDQINQILILEVKVGKIDNILLNNNLNDRRLKTLPLKNGSVFNIFDLDQAIENLNNASINTISNIQASNQYGFSNIYLQTQDQPFEFYTNMDNSGQSDMGEYRSSIAITSNNIFNINDSFNLTYSKNFPFAKSGYDEELYFASLSIPINNSKILFSFSNSRTSTKAYGYASEYTRKNNIYRYKIGLKHILTRINKTKVSIYSNINIKETKNTIDDIILETSSGRYNSISIGIETLSSISNGSIFSQLEYSKGVKLFGSRGNIKNSPYDTEFDIIKIPLSIQKYIYSNQNYGLLLKSNFATFYSKDSLLFADKFSIGSEYTVRGFKDSSVSLDYGTYLNNTLYLKLFDTNKYIQSFSPFIGIDFGYGRDYYLPNSDKLIGIAYGILYNIGNLNIKATFSKPIKKSSNMPDEKSPFYLDISFAI